METSPETPLLVRIFQTLELTLSDSRIKSLVPRTSVQIFQTLEVTIFGSSSTSLCIPTTSVFVQIFQTFEVTIRDSFKTSSSSQGQPFLRVFQTPVEQFGQQPHNYLPSKDIRFRANISNTRENSCLQPSNKCYHPKDIRFRARIANTRGIVGSSSTSVFMPGTSAFVQIFQTLELNIMGSIRTSVFIPRTPMFVCIFQTLR